MIPRLKELFFKEIQPALKTQFGFKNILLTNSCTSALEICSLALDVKEVDEVIVPSFSFITTASSFARKGCKIIFCDIEKKTLMPSLEDIKKCITKNKRVANTCHPLFWYHLGLNNYSASGSICAVVPSSK